MMSLCTVDTAIGLQDTATVKKDHRSFQRPPEKYALELWVCVKANRR